MRTRSKLVLIGFGATLLMAFAVGTASAGRLSISSQNITVSFNNLEFGTEGLATFSCNFTLEGTLHSRTIVKQSETLIGFIRRVTTSNCRSPTTILAATLPWHSRYVSFSGSLPDITLLTVKIVGVSFQVNTGATCLARGDINANYRREGAGRITGVDVPSQSMPLTGFLCPSTLFVRSSANGVSSALTITLI